MITQFECSRCGTNLHSDTDKKQKCLRCNVEMEMVFRKRWTGNVESGHDETWQKETDGGKS